ncbi:aminopeptidase N-like isoform X2 [Spea bombifrons]|uniref:aminopeptidase N-like isoform X2 n=1 Tax=Spea bombifrons TaxID=233779 RepID=UPI00234A9762|nr:aminopeptidase N-like isoform X2 [Spea bombifrons]
MAQGFFVGKVIAVVVILFAIASVAAIIALSVIYAEVKAKNHHLTKPTDATSTATTNVTLGSRPTSPTTDEPWNRFRLPKSLIPYHYDVELKPVLEKNSQGLYIFFGKSTVYFTCKEATKYVVIHSNKLNFTTPTKAVLRDAAFTDLPVLRVDEVPVTQYLVVHAVNNLEVGKNYSLFTTFRGELADDLAGFYRSEYVEDGQTKIIATTQMQAPDARKAFPCFDEPAMKATFNITLIHKPDYVALSNMNPIEKYQTVEEAETWNVTVFHKTVKMSTYLVAFIVSQFSSTGDPGNSTTTGVQIWGRKKAIEVEKQGEYALSISKPILDFFAEYYKAPYPLPKADQVALPDFSAGAMENWGLVTYRETGLLFDPQVSSISNKERIALLVAHELAHQWFGNLVTIRWWNDLWLNEGFASYVEYLGADKAEPTWNIKDLIVLYDVHRVMAIDALASSHPLTSKEEEVNTPAEISELFDAISYSKGASVIRMLSDFITEEVFVEGLATYLKQFEYDNTVYSDLWIHLQQAVNTSPVGPTLPQPIDKIMDRWVLQMGFPVVKINTTTGTVTQQHFLLDPESVVTRPSEFNYEWIVPISYSKSNSSGKLWLESSSEIFNEFKTTGSEWLLANINVTGYYRVNYDDGNWDRLIRQLESNHLAIPVINRAQIIDDAFNLARAKYINTTRALDTTRYISNDTEYMPWQAMFSSLSYFTQMFDRTEVYGPMKKYLKQQVTPLFENFKVLTENFTSRPESLTDQYSEINAINTACIYGIPECIQLAASLFREWMMNGTNGIHPNLRSSIYCTAIAHGGVAEWDFVWKKFVASDIAQESDKLRSALACSKEPWILNRLLEYSLDTSKIRRQDAVATINSVCSNVMGQNLAWDFVRAKWRIIFTQFGGSSFSFGNLIERVTRRFSTEFELQQLEQFKLANQDIGFGTATRTLEQAIEKTKANIKWVNENKESVRIWFEDAIRPRSI